VDPSPRPIVVCDDGDDEENGDADDWHSRQPFPQILPNAEGGARLTRSRIRQGLLLRTFTPVTLK
jgi:hypothetical protein